MLYFLPVTESIPKQVNTMVALFAVGKFFGTALYMSMYSIKGAWNMAFLASTIVSSQVLSCYRASC